MPANNRKIFSNKVENLTVTHEMKKIKDISRYNLRGSFFKFLIFNKTML